jgi:hypothetical protein
VFGDPGGKLGESAKRVSVSRNKFALSVVDVSKRAEAVNFQFIDELIGVEWFERR